MMTDSYRRALKSFINAQEDFSKALCAYEESLNELNQKRLDVMKSHDEVIATAETDDLIPPYCESIYGQKLSIEVSND